LKSSDNSAKSTWGLAQQGILMICILLAGELGFIGVLAYLLTQAESSANRQEHARQVTSKAGKLLLVVYDIEASAGQFDIKLEQGKDTPLKIPTAEIPGLISWLRNAYTGNTEAEQLIDVISGDFDVVLPTLKSASSITTATINAPMRKEWRVKRRNVLPKVREIIASTKALVDLGEKLENAGGLSDRERLGRQFTRKVLYIGLAVNVLIVFLVTFIVFKRIIARLDVLTDNIARLKDGRPLNPYLSGDDEIATLDAVFHETAAALRKEMKVLKASEERIRALIENLPVGIVMLDQNGNIELINSTIQSNFKYATHQLLGKRLAKLFVPGQAEADSAPHGEQSQKAFEQSLELTAMTRTGEQFPVEFMMAEIEMEGESKTLAMVLDASDKYKLKQMRNNFVAMVRSELKDPLVKIEAFLTALGSGSLGAISAKGATTTQAMQQNIERLIALLSDLFDLDKLESGKIEIAPAQTQLRTIFERSVNAVAMFAQNHKVQLQVANCDLEVYADANRIVQVLVNLLSNAIKFSPANSVVQVAVKRSARHIEIGVIDNGRGIPRSHLEAVFDAYKQVDKDDAQKKGGTGLGLAICKAIVEAHGGQIGVNSEEGRGSVFWFSVPVSAPAEGEAR
jgi:PAS domain S-box-containing protein